MTNENGEGEEIAIATEEICREFRLYNIPLSDAEYFRDIMHMYGGKGNAAFRALLDAYDAMTLVARLENRLSVIEQRVKDLEGRERKEMVKTFGGN